MLKSIKSFVDTSRKSVFNVWA